MQCNKELSREKKKEIKKNRKEWRKMNQIRNNKMKASSAAYFKILSSNV